MSDLIDREALKDELLNHYEVGNIEQNLTMNWVYRTVMDAPAVAAPRWVRCVERWPDKDNAYAACWTYQGVFYWGKVLFLNGEWQVDEGIPIPDYWMPIEPPKDKED